VLRLAHASARTASGAHAQLAVQAVNAGAWGNSLRVRVTPLAANAARFRLEVLADPANAATVAEAFDDLSLSATDSKFAAHAINGVSAYISVAVAGDAPPLAAGLVALAGGDEGPVLDPSGPSPGAGADFNSAVRASVGAGSVTDRIDLYNLACVPGLADGATVAAVQHECRRRRAFMLVDCERTATVAAPISAAFGAAIAGADALNSALYFPWVRAPDAKAAGAPRDFPPCGFVAGLYARTDGARGVWKAPAGTEASLTGVSGFTVPVTDTENGQLNPRAVNCLRTFTGRGNVVWGARTLHGDDARNSEWKYVPVRRLALFIEESLCRGTQWAAFEPNAEPLWAQLRLSVGAFMRALWRQGALQGATEKEGYFVRCDVKTTTAVDVNLGVVNIEVGFAPLKPAEFVILRIRQKAAGAQA
jgi:uncharacterized protein